MINDQGKEVLNVRFLGGPWEGDRMVVSAKNEWPPPAELEIDGITYIRIGYSNMPNEVAAHPHIVRGAKYRLRAIPLYPDAGIG